MAQVRFDGVTRRYRGGTVALDGLDLQVADGEFLTLVGPPGSGKSTALRLLAGLDRPTAGEVLVDGEPVTTLAPGRREVAMFFQGGALYPHMTVYGNLSYGLHRRRTPQAEITRRVREIAELLHVDALLDRKPGQLSGGQRQRVAMGRGLVGRPRAFLLDEPLANLDATLRGEARGDLRRLHRRSPLTWLYVTQDQVEAMAMSDRLCVLSGGRVQQIGTPDHVYKRPANAFVASFVGSPPMNLLPAEVRAGLLHVAGATLGKVPTVDGPVTLGVRPEHLRICFVGSEVHALRVRVDFVEWLGSHGLLTAIVEPTGRAQDASQPLRVVVRVAENSTLATGDLIGVALPPHETYFFDTDSGLARR